MSKVLSLRWLVVTVSAAMLLATLATLGLPYAVVRYLPGAGEAKNDLINSCFLISGIVAVLASIVFLAGLNWWAPSLVAIRQNTYLSVAFILFTTGITLGPLTLIYIFVASRRAAMGLVEGTVEGFLKLSLIGLLALFFGTSGVFTAWGLPPLLAFFFGALFLLPRVQPGYKPKPIFRFALLKSLLRFSIANYGYFIKIFAHNI